MLQSKRILTVFFQSYAKIKRKWVGGGGALEMKKKKIRTIKRRRKTFAVTKFENPENR